MAYPATDTQMIQAIVMLRWLERSVDRAMKAHAASPSERTLLALGLCMHRLESAVSGMESIAQTPEQQTIPMPLAGANEAAYPLAASAA